MVPSDEGVPLMDNLLSLLVGWIFSDKLEGLDVLHSRLTTFLSIKCMTLSRFPSKIAHDGYAVSIGGPMATRVAAWRARARRYLLSLLLCCIVTRKLTPTLLNFFHKMSPK